MGRHGVGGGEREREGGDMEWRGEERSGKITVLPSFSRLTFVCYLIDEWSDDGTPACLAYALPSWSSHQEVVGKHLLMENYSTQPDIRVCMCAVYMKTIPTDKNKFPLNIHSSPPPPKRKCRVF